MFKVNIVAEHVNAKRFWLAVKVRFYTELKQTELVVRQNHGCPHEIKTGIFSPGNWD